MRALPIHSPAISRTVVLCASKNIPLTNAAAAVSRLVVQVRANCAPAAPGSAHRQPSPPDGPSFFLIPPSPFRISVYVS
jgi:hypothetical protein